ncbi:MAG TPA: 2-amino-4-hydroxy-6-hydroxymethyldihydropteridine diphosphokinase [Xanthomonadaceae bacterium]|nr:2-amino-4-hydroxy-6-hydroxymethyldihydropteridine diphosphokinase [Xanthomonadaceae bacterium]
MPAEAAPPAVREFALVLGSNHRRARNLRLAARRIGERFEVTACTPALRTRDGDGTRYLNGAMRIRSTLPLPALRESLRAIEGEAGRTRGDARVALDIDIVASRDAAGRTEVHKPGDLQRDYVHILLARIGFP